MPDGPPLFTQFDISVGSTSTPPRAAVAEASETNQLLQQLVGLQHKSCDLLLEILAQVSLSHRQRTAELKAWKEANPELAESCRRAAESLSRVHTEFLASVAREAAENADDFGDSEYALGEFIDRYGPRLAHFNGVLQLFAQLAGGPPKQATET